MFDGVKAVADAVDAVDAVDANTGGDGDVLKKKRCSLHRW